MREKKLYCIITFHTTAAAIETEKLCHEAGLPGRLIPVPREISSSCGMAWRCPTGSREEVSALIQREKVEVDGFYELVI